MTDIALLWIGRKRSLTPHQQREARERLAGGETQRSVARSYDVSQAAISRLEGDKGEAMRDIPPPVDGSHVLSPRPDCRHVSQEVVRCHLN